MIIIKSAEEQKLMRSGGKVLANILKKIKESTTPGTKKSDLNKMAEDLCRQYKVKPSFKNYGGFPASICVSVNEEVVHSIPDDDLIKEGDLVSLDMGVLYQGFHTDSALSFICSELSGEDYKKKYSKELKLINVCEQSLYSGIELIKNGVHLGDISNKIQGVVESRGFGVVRMLVGHGIGREVHEDPHVPNFGSANTGPILKTGMTIAVEPMVILDGSVDVILDEDGWTYKSASGALTAHFEHTVLVTDDGYEILTS